MKRTKTSRLFFLSIVLSLGSLSCSTQTDSQDQADYMLAQEFGIDSNLLVYQYYQKFGFTDACEDLRMVAKCNAPSGLALDLPISEHDREIINSFTNKADQINDSLISFSSNTRKLFHDIELNFIEFKPSTLPVIQLQKGKYEIVQEDHSATLKVYDKESELLYIETHRCD